MVVVNNYIALRSIPVKTFKSKPLEAGVKRPARISIPVEEEKKIETEEFEVKSPETKIETPLGDFSEVEQAKKFKKRLTEAKIEDLSPIFKAIPWQTVKERDGVEESKKERKKKYLSYLNRIIRRGTKSEEVETEISEAKNLFNTILKTPMHLVSEDLKHLKEKIEDKGWSKWTAVDAAMRRAIEDAVRYDKAPVEKPELPKVIDFTTLRPKGVK